MAYASIQTLLVSYKMQKADEEFKLSQLSLEHIEKTKESKAINDELNAEKAAVSSDDPEYAQKLSDIDDKFRADLEEIAAWESSLEHEKDNCEVKIKQLDGYINSWQSALTAGIQSSHTYGSTGH